MIPTLAEFWFPPSASTAAEDVHGVFHFVLWIGLFFFCLICVLVAVFVVRYRRRPGHAEAPSPAHNTPLELTWTIIPLLIVLTIFALGFRGFLGAHTPYANAYEVQVEAYRWAWRFRYPNDHTDPVLHLPSDRPVKLTLTSTDVIHSLWIPAFGLKRDAVPGRFNTLWFRPTRVGEFDALCAEYCGTQHSLMTTKAVVHKPGEFEAWLAEASRNPLDELDDAQLAFWAASPDLAALRARFPELVEKDARKPFLDKLLPLWKQGAELYRYNCATCHDAGLGPGLMGLWARKTEVVRVQGVDQTVDIDENYLRESILYPSAKVAKGWDDRMSSFKGKLSDRQIIALIEYIKRGEGQKQ